MLDESSYLTAIYSYCGAAIAILLYMTWWLGRYWRAAWVALTVLLSAALLLTPAHPNAEVSTFAPALIVAVFELLTHGPEAAWHALKPLAFMGGAAVVMAILLWLLIFRRSAPVKANSQAAEKAA